MQNLGLTLREQAEGEVGAKIDVYISSKYRDTMDVMMLPVADQEKPVPIVMWGSELDEKLLNIAVTYSNADQHHESFEHTGDWIKLERVGQIVNVHVSNDGNVWSLVRDYTLPMLDEAYMGVMGSDVSASIAVDYKVANDNVFYLHPDHLKSVYSVSSNAAKLKVWERNDFDLVSVSPFGFNTGSKSLFQMPLRFPGQYLAATTGVLP